MLSSLLNSSRSCSHLNNNDHVVAVFFQPLLPVDAQQEGGVAAGLHGPGQLDTVQFSSPRSVEWSTWARYCEACFGLNLSGPSKAAPAHLDRTVVMRTKGSVGTYMGSLFCMASTHLTRTSPTSEVGWARRRWVRSCVCLYRSIT